MRQAVRALLREKLGVPLGESVRMLTTFEVAGFLRVSRYTLSGWRKKGAGPPFVKLSRRTLRYPREAFEQYVRSRLSRGVVDREPPCYPVDLATGGQIPQTRLSFCHTSGTTLLESRDGIRPQIFNLLRTLFERR